MEKNHQKLVVAFFGVLFAGVLFLLYRILQPFLHTLLLSLILAGLFYPVFRRTTRLLKGRRIPASLLTCLLVLLTVFVPLIFFVAALSNEAYSLYTVLTEKILQGDLERLVEKHRGLLADWMDQLAAWNIHVRAEHIGRNLGELGKNLAFFTYQQASSFVANLAKFMVHFLFLLLILFCLFLEGERLRGFVFSLSPLPEDQERFLIEKFNGMARVILLVNGLSGIIQGILGGLGFWIFGLPSPFLWGAVLAILAFLPILGISFVSIPCALVLFLSKRYLVAAAVLIYFTTISLCVEYLMKSLLVGQQAKIHPILILLAIMGGLNAFGVLGILYGPLILTAFLSLVEVYRKSYETSLLGKSGS